MPKSSAMNPTDASTVDLGVKSQDGTKLFFKIKCDAQLKTLLTCYCDRKFMEYKTVQFLINGERFNDRYNADDLGSVDGDAIDATLPVNGGGHWIA